MKGRSISLEQGLKEWGVSCLLWKKTKKKKKKKEKHGHGFNIWNESIHIYCDVVLFRAFPQVSLDPADLRLGGC